ncbi:ketoacyl-ACP synthase III [Pendulispora rubella]|uniref:Ketoacyl-ACP synthase III n=1 Tax=Pendulispora rubella TaxID=2741070 RepID=A0ABZ2KVE2_9BACT
MPRSPVHIVDIGTYIPPQRASNTELGSEFQLDSEFLRNKIGVFERSIKDAAESTSDLCQKAFEDLLRRRSIDIASVQLVCVVTQNPDRNIPHTSAIVHQKLGMGKQCITFDISQGCAGYTHGIAVVTALVEKLGLERALLFTCDPYSTIVDRNDKATALIFGDAASVSYICRNESGYELIDSDFGTVPHSWQCLVCDDGRFRMDGRQVFSNAAREVPLSIHRLLERNGLNADDVDCFLLHPGSKYIIDFLRQNLALPPSKVPFEIAHYGNTVSSSIPIMLQQRMSRTEKDARLVLSGFGVGFSWGSNILEFKV